MPLALPDTQTATTTLNRIRVETALSRFPIHRLARKGDISIDLQSGAGVKWEVTYNIKYGQPGPLAYKLDTLIVNRRIDEAPRPLPEIIKLGSLREICRGLGLADHDTESVKRAFHQNASAYITAKIRYKTRTGRERWTEIGYSRYSVVFTGEMLPDGTTADAVCIVINASHRDLLNQVEVRPLDYDYLMELAPGPQRFYELLSFQIYGAIASGRPRAKMLYSDYCKYAPQVRYPDFDHVKKQMFKIHIPHRQSGYITKVEYQETRDSEDNSDWEMLYTAGPKAQAEFKSFTNRQVKQQGREENSLSSATIIDLSREPAVQGSLFLSDTNNPLLSEMMRRGITEKKALDLLTKGREGQEMMDQLEYVDHIIANAPLGKFHNPSGLYVRFLEDNSPVPESFWTNRKKRLHEEAQQCKNAELSKQAQLETDYEEYRRSETERSIRETIAADEYQTMFDKIREQNRCMYKQISPAQLDEITRAAVAYDLRESGRIPTLSFEEFRKDRLATVGQG